MGGGGITAHMFQQKVQIQARKILENLSREFSPIFKCIRVPLILMLGERENRRLPISRRLVNVALDSIFLLKLLVRTKVKIEKIEWAHIFVIDHNRESHISFFLKMIERIPESNVCIITTSHSIYKRLNGSNFHKVIFINNFVKINIKEIQFLLKVSHKIATITIVERLSIFIDLLRAASYEKIYKNILSNNNYSIVTLCDAHLHEQVITKVANKKNISTYTMQHGMPNKLWFPIVSDYFFIWSKHTKEVCNKKFSVSNSNMIISGNPYIYTQEVSRIQNNIFTITYIVTNWGEIENKKLFKMFIKISNIKNIKIIIKLRPNPSFEMLNLYRSWARKTECDNIQVIYKDSIHKVLSQTDLIVTFHSGVPVDAISYNVPSILLDIFEYIDLEELVDHFNDCIIVDNIEDYIGVVNKIVKEKDFYNALVKKVRGNREKYIHNMNGDDSIEFMVNTITKYNNLINSSCGSHSTCKKNIKSQD
jgi:hypothetical protein